MSSEFEEALREALQRKSDAQSASQKAEAEFQNKRAALRALIEPTLRELGGQVARKLTELNVPLQTAHSKVRYWDFSPFYMTISEDGFFMRPYSIQFPLSSGRLTNLNTGQEACREFDIFIDDIYRIKGDQLADTLPGGSIGGNVSYYYPQYGGGIAVTEDDKLVVVQVTSMERNTFNFTSLSSVMGGLVASKATTS